MDGLIVLAILITIGYVFGKRAESRHLKDLQQRERRTQLLSTTMVGGKSGLPQVRDAQLVVGSVVVASDYFKTFIAGFINLAGGRITVYESLLERGRREAVVRAQEAALAWGATHLVNLRIETAELGGQTNNGLVSVEVTAYGTALK